MGICRRRSKVEKSPKFRKLCLHCEKSAIQTAALAFFLSAFSEIWMKRETFESANLTYFLSNCSNPCMSCSSISFGLTIIIHFLPVIISIAMTMLPISPVSSLFLLLTFRRMCFQANFSRKIFSVRPDSCSFLSFGVGVAVLVP